MPAEDAAVYAITQRPATAAVFCEPTPGPPAWQTIPAYDLISGADPIIPPTAQQFMAKRANATVQVVEGASHMVFVSHPDTTVAFIEKAARQTAG